MSDTWSDIQAHKKQLDSLRERLQRRRKENSQLALDIVNPDASLTRSDSPGPPAAQSQSRAASESQEIRIDPELENRLLMHLSDLGLTLPTDSITIKNALSTPEHPVSQASIESLLLKFSAQELIELRPHSASLDPSRPTPPTLVTSADHTKLWAMMGAITGTAGCIGAGTVSGSGLKRKGTDLDAMSSPSSSSSVAGNSTPSSLHSHLTGSVGLPPISSISFSPSPSLLHPSSLSPSLSYSSTGDKKGSGTLMDVPATKKARSNKQQASDLDLEIESLLSQQSTKQQQSKKVSREILELLNTTTAKEQSIVEKFRSRGRAQVQEFCDHGTKEECVKACEGDSPCRKLHFRRIINKHTDESLGDCSFLNTCFHMDTCKYVHYEIDCPPEGESGALGPQTIGSELGLAGGVTDPTVGKLFPSQWICCDIRYLDVSILGKFAVVMADPPWDIHMELPYGTLTDDEMRKLNVPALQDDGFLFLWVTGRAMELGQECLKLWGYERVDEIIWVKTNQLQRIIRTGRTGHWLNHGKEHCLVGVKGSPQGFNRGLDCDVIVAEVRSTSHKPDEIYGIIERLSPGTRKIELFGRPHNLQPNWVTLGNQLDGIHLLDPDVVARFKKRYPDGVISKPKNM
ncbi:N6-adenosine-methyltransferase subunit METTL3 [Erpetoichthys calabaricus]|uniref:N6-adenosine-methyltransferase subunit METTL3 n=1 Tax=Erpetoichthys calabaricus TaxID=27687 RepID=UPI00223487E6|nr:N6-adenosine-methyltransferase subunit METTL3 [Erpetoichthys calabaricus]